MAAMRAREAASRLGHEAVSKAHEPMEVRLVGSVTVTRAVQYQKANSPMEVTPSGMVMAVRELQLHARHVATSVMPAGRVRETSEERKQKAQGRISVTLSGMTRAVSLFSQKADAPMLCSQAGSVREVSLQR